MCLRVGRLGKHFNERTFLNLLSAALFVPLQLQYYVKIKTNIIHCKYVNSIPYMLHLYRG